MLICKPPPPLPFPARVSGCRASGFVFGSWWNVCSGIEFEQWFLVSTNINACLSVCLGPGAHVGFNELAAFPSALCEGVLVFFVEAWNGVLSVSALNAALTKVSILLSALKACYGEEGSEHFIYIIESQVEVQNQPLIPGDGYRARHCQPVAN